MKNGPKYVYITKNIVIGTIIVLTVYIFQEPLSGLICLEWYTEVKILLGLTMLINFYLLSSQNYEKGKADAIKEYGFKLNYVYSWRKDPQWEVDQYYTKKQTIEIGYVSDKEGFETVPYTMYIFEGDDNGHEITFVIGPHQDVTNKIKKERRNGEYYYSTF